MGAQTVILPYGQPAGYPGLFNRVLDSKSAQNAEASACIGYGLGVKPGTLVKQALLPTATSSVLLGITRNVSTNAPGSFGGLNQDATPDGIRPNYMMEVVNIGRGFVQVDADAVVVPNLTRLYWRAESNGGNTRIGTFTSIDDGHVVDTRGQVLAIGPIFSTVDVLSGGTTKMCEVSIDTTGLPT